MSAACLPCFALVCSYDLPVHSLSSAIFTSIVRARPFDSVTKPGSRLNLVGGWDTVREAFLTGLKPFRAKRYDKFDGIFGKGEGLGGAET